MIEPKIPDFSSWTTSRLKFLLIEYRESLPGIRVLYGRNDPEYKLLSDWVAAIEAELAKREAAR